MFSLIAAVGKNRELGKKGGLIFNLKEDMAFFKKTTKGHPVIMGYNTWKSLPKKLPGRKNIVVNNNKVEGADLVVNDLAEFISENEDSPEEIFIIGGGMLYAELLPYAKTLYLTEIDAKDKEAEVFFPEFDKDMYNKRIIKKGSENGINYQIISYTKKNIVRSNMKDIVFELIEKEKKRQTEGLELIPSENYVSGDVLKAMGSVLTNKYSEGYPNFEGIGKIKDEWTEEKISKKILKNYRYYGGQANVDRIERLAIDRACRLFNADHANVQPHSGAQANNAVYFAWLEPGDTVLGMSLPAGGHLTHGSPVTMSAHIYHFVGYGVTEDGDIDYKDLEEKALKNDPKIILVGYSAFMKIPDFDRIAKIRDKVEKKVKHEVMLMADMAHVAGLIAGGIHPNPLDHGFDVMTTTTHKTLRGPRGGLILSKGNVASPLKKPEKNLKNIPILIDRAVFPGTQGGPLEHIIAAKAVAFGEDLKPSFKSYTKKIVENAKTLAKELMNLGFILQGNGTDNHLILINVKKSFGFDGKIYEKALDIVGLTLNANALPNDKGAAFRPSGVRLGTPAITTRGLGTPEMKKIALWMKKVADICKEAETEENLEKYVADLETIRLEVRDLALKFPIPGI